MVAVTLQDLVVKVHQKRRKRNVHNDRYALPLNEPVAFLTRCIDVSRAANDDEAHNDNCRCCRNERQIRPAQEALREYHRLRLEISLPPC